MKGNNNDGKAPQTNEAAQQAAELKRLSMKGLKLELDDLTNFIEEEILGEFIDLSNTVETHNSTLKIVSDNQLALQNSIDLLASEILVLQTGTPPVEAEAAHPKIQAAPMMPDNRDYGPIVPSPEAAQLPPLTQPPAIIISDKPEPPHIEYQEPVPQEDSYAKDLKFGTHQHVVLETIADSCIVMNDILLLCKAMRKVPELTDQSRIALLYLAGRRAGIEITPGMQVRAGVKMIVA